ncbi:MAG: sugar ABC transporter ATP-binding protein, partial [Planctomycetia bacterium]
VVALDGVSLRLERGETLAVVGENGAGKSTLMKILAGVETPDAGAVTLDGKPVRFGSVREAQYHGVALIHQELNLADNLDCAANIFLGREPHRFGFIDRRKLRADAAELMKQVGLDTPPRALVGTLSIGRRQMVEIAKALAVKARVLIMDEPTSSLSQHETDKLFEVIDQLKARGVSILYISHRLGEVKRVADRVVALRDGRNAGELPRDAIDEDRMVSLMVGRDASARYRRGPSTPGAVALEVENLVTRAYPERKVSFQVRRGEIVGVAGLVGAGRTELLEALFGVTPALSGTVKVDGVPVRVRRPYHAVAAGLALAPEDRKQQGLFLAMSVARNISMPGLWRHRVAGLFLPLARERSAAAAMVKELRIKTPKTSTVVGTLSGGNQQKTVLAKWLELKPTVLLLDEPTRGVDVAAKEEIYRKMEEAAARGAA